MGSLQVSYEFLVLVMLGIGQAGMLIPSLGAMKFTVPSGDSAATEACVSLFNTFQQAGLVVGPWVSSALGSQYVLGNTGIGLVIMSYCVFFSKLLCRGSAGATSLGEPLIPV